MTALPMHRSGLKRGGWIALLVVFFFLLIGARAIAGYFIDYQWWKEMGQVPTWLSMLAYGVSPTFGAAAIAFVVFWISHARAVKKAGTHLGDHPLYARLSGVVLLLVAIIFALAVIDSWTVVRYVGGRSLPANATASPSSSAHKRWSN